MSVFLILMIAGLFGMALLAIPLSGITGIRAQEYTDTSDTYCRTERMPLSAMRTAWDTLCRQVRRPVFPMPRTAAQAMWKL